MKQQERFHHSVAMESVEWELTGHDKCRSSGESAFVNPEYFRKKAKSHLKKIRRRIDSVLTGDPKLHHLLSSDIDAINNELDLLSVSYNSDIDIVAYFFKLVAHLLGWANIDGRFYRTPVYHQTQKQRERDHNITCRMDPIEEKYRKRQIILRLRTEGYSHSDIASIMNQSESDVKATEKSEHIDELYGSRHGK